MGAVKHTPLKTPQSLGFYTIDQIIRNRATEENQVPLLACPSISANKVDDYELVTGHELDRLIDGAAKKFLSCGIKPVVEDTVLGLIGISDLDYVVNVFALGRLGYTTFLLSPRLSGHAIVTLLSDAKAQDLLYAPSLRILASSAEIESEIKLNLIPMLTRADYDAINDTTARFERQGIDPLVETKKNLILLHSSGSTGIPKLAHYTNGRLLATLLTAHHSRSGLTTFPLFHAYGFVTIIQAIWTRIPLYLFSGHIPQTNKTVTDALKLWSPEMFYTVPYVLKLISEKEEGLIELRRCKEVSISGSVCPDELGDLLIKEGVQFGSSFGATEVAMILTSVGRPRDDKAWNYMRPPPHVAPFLWMKPIPSTSNPIVHECVVLDGHIAKMKSNSNDPPNSFYTSDLFVKHPTINNAWKFVGRLDDRVTLLNGEKVLPLAIEGRVLQETCVKDAVVFGVEREVPGILVFRAAGENCSEIEFLDKVWPAIKDANSRAESFSQISREMVIVLTEGVECPTTDKSSIKRAQVYRDFADVIDEAYAKQQSTQGATLYLDTVELQNWIMQTFHSLGVDLDDGESDFFSTGVDSLKAIQMRSLIVKNLDMKGNVTKISSMVVYDCGNTKKLASTLIKIRDGSAGIEMSEDDFVEMEEMIKRFSMFTPRTSNVEVQERASKEKVVLLTGATGSLGSHVLSQLASTPHVSKIYCTVRKTRSSETAQERLEKATNSHGFQIASSQNIIPLLTDDSAPNMGLPSALFEQMHAEATHIIHCAWNVNFMLPVTAFESQLKGLQNLINLSLTSPLEDPPQMLFCSSVGVAMGSSRSSEDVLVPEGPITDLSAASPTGYSRSKLIAERMIETARTAFGANASVLRVGQIIPAAKEGSQLWNPSEMVPLIVRSATATVVLPEFPAPNSDDRCTWIDAATLAGTILDIAGLHGTDATAVGAESQLVYNLVGPVSISWQADFLPLLKRAGLQFEVKSWGSWLDRLRALDEDDPCRKLLSFWDESTNLSSETGKMGGIVFRTEKAKDRSKTFRASKGVVDDGYVERLLCEWRAVW